jgi:hypothetical protein
VNDACEAASRTLWRTLQHERSGGSSRVRVTGSEWVENRGDTGGSKVEVQLVLICPRFSMTPAAFWSHVW